MDGPSAKKSNSLETLVIQNITNVNDLKAKLNDIIKLGKNYEYDVSNCLTALLKNSDQEIVTLAVQAISELAKCEDKRETFAKKDVIDPIMDMLGKDVTTDRLELVKQCCRALGNLCCDCDTSRKLVLDHGVNILTKLLKTTLDNTNLSEIKIFTCKTLLNYAIGGQQFTESIVESGLIELMQWILAAELESEDMDDDLVSTVLLILSVVNDNTPEFLFSEDVNLLVLRVLRETVNMEISELCLDHLLLQAEHESVKALLARQECIQHVCCRLEALLRRQASRELRASDSEVDALVKQACDLLVLVLTGDEAMHLLYENGHGAVYETTVRWLEASNPHLLSAAVLAIGNFARQDDYCAAIMETHIFDKLLDIFETHHKLGLELKQGVTHSIDLATASKVQHAALSALRNLTVSAANKKVAASKGRAAPVLLGALPTVEDHHVAYKLLAALRMLVDGQESVARQLASDRAALAAAARWGGAEHAGAAGEAPRLLAWSCKLLPRAQHWRNYVEVDGCISCLVNMLIASHSVMQNEAILALTLLSIHCLKDKPDIEIENTLIAHLLKSEIGKHVSVLLETNCAKMPIQVVENLLAFLDVTSKVNQLALDFKDAKVGEALQKLMDARTDLSDDLKSCVLNVIATMADK
ncbi:GTPase-GDP dissociation stimulator vimar [Cydia splendana]|uniref:GTPase-GDP dissociation stimulator vimar n=1 Tax=Cydia splendana TaxID=1100963 RepID=UPI00300D159C